MILLVEKLGHRQNLLHMHILHYIIKRFGKSISKVVNFVNSLLGLKQKLLFQFIILLPVKRFALTWTNVDNNPPWNPLRVRCDDHPTRLNSTYLNFHPSCLLVVISGTLQHFTHAQMMPGYKTAERTCAGT